MAGKKQNTKPSRSSRALQVMFLVFSIILILSMILSAFLIPQ
jgi:hypothetical protein